MTEARPGADPLPSSRAERVLVVFTGATDLRALAILRPGFRHCFAVVESGGQWLIYDPASHQTRIEPIGRMALANLLGGLSGGDATLVCRRQRAAPLRLAPLAPFTCVEAVKRLLGIRAPWVLTPWQLFRLLTADNR